jgi:hypothetical protein
MRRAAESLMTASCQVYRKTGSRRDGVRVVAVWELVYEGRAKVQTYEGHERTVGGVTGASTVEQRSSLHVPVGAFRPMPGDVARITASTDPLMVGRLWRIVQQYPVKEHATAYRAFVDELVGDSLAEFEGASA